MSVSHSKITDAKSTNFVNYDTTEDIGSNEISTTTCSSKVESESVPNKESTMRTHTIIIDTSCSSSTDVGVQATPAAVSEDLKVPHKQHQGILPVSSNMRNSAVKDRESQPDNQYNVTNTKEKTPMCLINELARFNKLAHKYVLVDEKGPAHKKEFHIRLDLGTEVYHATGTSIKRAQHAAAEVALGITKLKKPPAKQPKAESPPASNDKKRLSAVTPTVELNALAMKLGEHPEYVNIDAPAHTYFSAHLPAPPHHHPYLYPRVHDYYRSPHPPRMVHSIYPNPFLTPHSPRTHVPPPLYAVSLRIGRHEFKGQGTTRQQARHNAANKALKVLSNIPVQRTTPPPNNLDINKKSQKDQAFSEISEKQSTAGEDVSNNLHPSSPTSSDDSGSTNSSIKSEISLVHELALQCGKAITFEVIHESGPPHMKTFITRSVCGDLVSQGEGNSKKRSKKKAAEKMLELLRALDQPAIVSKQKVKNVANKKKNRNLIKIQKANVDYGCGINPISRLIQIQQANKRKEPVYTLVLEQGLPRRREFIIQVECNDKVCQGKGPNKKLAKRNAAEEMLQLMGYSKPSPPPGKSALKSPDHSNNGTSQHNKHVTFVDSTNTNKLPGVLVRADAAGILGNQEMPPFKADLAASLAKELLEKGKSVVGETLLPAKEHPKYPLKRPREQLEYLGSCMGFAIEFTDFPKGSTTNMCLTLVTLQTNPAQVFHGSASTVDQSHDKAALQALNKLAQSAPDDDSVEEITPPVNTPQEQKSEQISNVKIEIEGKNIEQTLNVKAGTGNVMKSECNGEPETQSTETKKMKAINHIPEGSGDSRNNDTSLGTEH